MRVARHPFPLKPRMSVGVKLSVPPAPPPPSSLSMSISPASSGTPPISAANVNGVGTPNSIKGPSNTGAGNASSSGLTMSSSMMMSVAGTPSSTGVKTNNNQNHNNNIINNNSNNYGNSTTGTGNNGNESTAKARRSLSGGKSWLAAAAAPPRSVSKTGHVLHRTFQFSYVRRTAERWGGEDYAQQIRDIATVGTVEEFWAVYVHLHRVSKLAPSTDYFLFQQGVKPMWEDDANRGGGRLTIRVTKTASPRAFEDLCLALIGEQFDTDDVCGIACSVRVAENFLSIWLHDAKNRDLIAKVEGIARRALDLPVSCIMRDWSFKAHQVDQSVPSAATDIGGSGGPS